MSNYELMEELERLECIDSPSADDVDRIYEIEQILSERSQ